MMPTGAPGDSLTHPESEVPEDMDWLDPQADEDRQVVYLEPIFCQSCGCYVDRSDTPSGPDKFCPSEVCGCHSPYWATVAESTKRSLWGDR